MAKLFIQTDMFNINQSVFLIQNDVIVSTTKVPLDQFKDLPIFNLEREKDSIDEININGNQKFIEKIGYDIISNLKNNYSNRQVRIKLNGEIFNK